MAVTQNLKWASRSTEGWPLLISNEWPSLTTKEWLSLSTKECLFLITNGHPLSLNNPYSVGTKEMPLLRSLYLSMVITVVVFCCVYVDRMTLRDLRQLLNALEKKTNI